jgi:hypothetical protein
MTEPRRGTVTELERVGEDTTLPEVIDALNKLIEEYSVSNRSISIQSNFDGYIAESVVFAIGATVKIQHFLGIKPKWRIILLQVGNGVLTDIPSEWNDKTISLKNNGAVEVTATIFIARE